MAKVKVIVIDKKCYPELLEKYCADPNRDLVRCLKLVKNLLLKKVMVKMIFGKSLYLCWITGGFNHGRLDERRK